MLDIVDVRGNIRVDGYTEVDKCFVRSIVCICKKSTLLIYRTVLQARQSIVQSGLRQRSRLCGDSCRNCLQVIKARKAICAMNSRGSDACSVRV